MLSFLIGDHAQHSGLFQGNGSFVESALSGGQAPVQRVADLTRAFQPQGERGDVFVDPLGKIRPRRGGQQPIAIPILPPGAALLQKEKTGLPREPAVASVPGQKGEIHQIGKPLALMP